MRKIRQSAATAATCQRNGAMFEDLAAMALDCAGFKGICNLNETVRRHFPFADLLAEENGVWYAISVKGRHKIMLTGKVNNRYKLDMTKAQIALAELRSMGYECVPAWVAIEIENERFNAYFGRLQDSLRKNGIGMNESEEDRIPQTDCRCAAPA
jgi:Holliday junction resolvase-like predicted endonuclease